MAEPVCISGGTQGAGGSGGGLAGEVAQCGLAILPRGRTWRPDSPFSCVLHRHVSCVLSEFASGSPAPCMPHGRQSLVWHFSADSEGESSHLPYLGSL